MMLTKTQIVDTIEGLKIAITDNARSVISAKLSGPNGVHRIIAQAPALHFALSALAQMQTLLAEVEDAEQLSVAALEESSPEDPFAKRMREAREAKITQRKRG